MTVSVLYLSYFISDYFYFYLITFWSFLEYFYSTTFFESIRSTKYFDSCHMWGNGDSAVKVRAQSQHWDSVTIIWAPFVVWPSFGHYFHGRPTCISWTFSLKTFFLPQKYFLLLILKYCRYQILFYFHSSTMIMDNFLLYLSNILAK